MAKTKTFVKNIDKQDFNYLVFFNMFFAVVGSLFLAWRDFKAGVIYTLMFLVLSALMFWIFFWIKDDSKLNPITKYLKVPIVANLPLSAFFYLLFFAIPMLVELVLRLAKSSFSITTLSIPLFGASIREGFNSFSTAEIGSSMPWKLFTIMFTAGTIETFAYNFVLPFVLVLIALFILKAINDGKDLGFIPKRYFVLTFVFIMTMLGFIMSHVLNSTYTFFAYVMAGTFLIVANFSIYLGGSMFSAWMGYHQGNNLVYLIVTEGIVAVAKGFISWFGLIFFIYLALCLFLVIRKWKVIVQSLKFWKYFSSS